MAGKTNSKQEVAAEFVVGAAPSCDATRLAAAADRAIFDRATSSTGGRAAMPRLSPLKYFAEEHRVSILGIMHFFDAK